MVLNCSYHELRDRIADALSPEAHAVWEGMRNDDRNEWVKIALNYKGELPPIEYAANDFEKFTQEPEHGDR